MAGNAVIGSLRVDLGLNTAQFQQGLKNAQTSMSSFGKLAAKSMAVVAVAATAAAAAMGYAVKGAIDHADELGKTSQKIGMSVEALSRLEFAAKLSDVSLEGLTTGLRKFAQVMVEAAGNSESRPAQVFAALGVAVKDAAGNLRNSDQVFADVSARFAAMEDGALKTALAVQLFGKSGADLIPLLNSGKDGLAAMANEADRLGVTISTKTAKSAEVFNDTITRINQSLQGVVNKVMEAALPALQSLANAIASPEFASAAEWLATTVVGAINQIIEAARAAANALNYLATHDMFGNQIATGPGSDAYKKGLWKSGGAYSQIRDAMGNGTYSAPTSDFYSGIFGSGATGGGTTSPAFDFSGLSVAMSGAEEAGKVVAKMLDENIPRVEDFTKAIGDGLAGAFNSFADAVLSGVPAIEALSDVLGDLGKQLLNSAISSFFGNLFAGNFGTIAGGSPIPKVGFIPGITGPKLFAKGGIADQPSIFGDAGPEAAVPLPDGRSIPVTLSGDRGGGSTEVLIRIDQGLVAQILKQADSNAVQIVDSRAPAAVAKTQRNRGM